MKLVPTRRPHIAHVAEHMRLSDRMEIWAASHLEPLGCLESSVLVTDRPMTLMADGEPVCICGVSKIPGVPDVGVPWMLGTDRVEAEPLPFLRVSREWITEQQRRWPLLVNYSDARQVKAHRWLEWLGFTLYPAEPWGVERMPFRRFEMRQEKV